MRNFLTIIRTLYSSRLFAEILLAVELVLVVQLLALATAPVSYLDYQIETADKYWGEGSYLYYSMSPSPQKLLEPEAVITDHPEAKEFYQGTVEDWFVTMDENPLNDSEGNSPGILLVRYNASLFARISDILDIRKEISFKDTVPVCVPLAAADRLPLGTVLFMSDGTRVDGHFHEVSFTVCGTILEDQIPVTMSSAGYQTVDSLTINTQEQLDNNRILLVSCAVECPPVYGGMFRLSDDTDGKREVEMLNQEHLNEGSFFTYNYVRSESKQRLNWVNKPFLLQGMLLLLIFFSHFVGYLSVSTRNKEHVNALLSICGMTPMKLAVYNVCSILLILLPSFLIAVLIVPLTEKWSHITAYGGHSMLWKSMGVFAISVFLVCYFTVRIRMKKYSEILLYRKGA